MAKDSLFDLERIEKQRQAVLNWHTFHKAAKAGFAKGEYSLYIGTPLRTGKSSFRTIHIHSAINTVKNNTELYVSDRRLLLLL